MTTRHFTRSRHVRNTKVSSAERNGAMSVARFSTFVVSLLLVGAVTAFVSTDSVVAAPIGDGTKIGIDLGPTSTANWNNFNSNTTDASIVDLTNTAVDGVSITTSNGQFYNNDGTNNWTGLSTNAGSAPPEFVDSVTTDIGGNFNLGDGSPFTITITGLDTSFLYDIVGVSTANFTPIDTYTIIGAVASAPSPISRPLAQSNGLFHTFTGIAPTVGGTITIQVVDTNTSSNPIANGILLTANAPPVPPTPEPSTLLLSVLGLIGLCFMRRRRVPVAKATALLAIVAISCCALTPQSHAAVVGGDVIAVDLSSGGGSATNYNVFNSNTTIGAGSVVRLSDGNVVTGVSLTFAGAGGFNNDANANAWPGTGGDPFYVGAADDISFGGTQTLTYAGLDDSLTYNVRIYSLIGNNPSALENFSVTDGGGTTGITNSSRGSRWNAATLELGGTVFNGVSTDGSGNIVVQAIPVTANAFLNAVTLEAVAPPSPATPEPTTMLLLCVGLASIAVCRPNRRD